MRAQILFVGGPFDMHLASYASFEAEFPLEMRVGSYDEYTAGDPEDFHAAVYRRGEIENMPASLMKYGSYEFVGMKPSTRALVSVWVQ